MPDPTLLGLVRDQLNDHPPAVAGAGELVLAAFDGPAGLEPAPGGTGARPASPGRSAAPTPAGVFLASVTVEGFRGIGPPVTLQLSARPGLTLVLGRNGSGKSSIAEALEMLLTGSNRRWAARSRVWTDGWRNLHHGPPRVSATFAVEGRVTALNVARGWADGADFAASTLSIDGKRRSLEESGWSEALTSFPPLLSHNELSRILEGRPTELYDALASILGLGEIAAAEAALRDARVTGEKAIREQQRAADEVVARLEDVDDERAAAARAALMTPGWDLEAVGQAVAGGLTAVEDRGELRTLRELSTLPVVDRERVRASAARLREVAEELERLGGSDAAAALETATLLEQALAVHAPHEGLACPVCGTEGVLTYEWRLRTGARITELREEASAMRSAHARADQARAEARALVLPVPPVLAEAAAVGVDTVEALQQWRRWAALPADATPAALSAHLEAAAPDLIAAVAAVRGAAGAELEGREDRWRPLARQLATWLPGAERAQRERAILPRLKAAEAWLKGAHEVLREQRFEPVAAAVQDNWQELRQNSSVQLGHLRLEGTGTSNMRHLTLDVTVDGQGGSALGVMSQGELNCLALSLFLPRASLPESPFRFLVIDDPVQAMDPVKVEGLARVLDRVGRHRQVVVLTHDDRLAEAVRRLEMEATIIEVSRRESSVVELRTALDPVQRHIEDAMAVAMSRDLPEEARRVVPGFCRYALEAACADAVSRRMRRQGRGQDEVDAALAAPTTLVTWLALALLHDVARAGDVMPRLAQRYPWATDVVRLANRGSHTAIPADLTSLVRAAEQLCARIREDAGDGG